MPLLGPCSLWVRQKSPAPPLSPPAPRLAPARPDPRILAPREERQPPCQECQRLWEMSQPFRLKSQEISKVSERLALQSERLRLQPHLFGDPRPAPGTPRQVDNRLRRGARRRALTASHIVQVDTEKSQGLGLPPESTGKKRQPFGLLQES